MSAGIDYGSGKTNIDVATGTRFGVISQHDIMQAWADRSVPYYGKPTCPKCGDEAEEYGGDLRNVPDDWQKAKGESADFICERCEYVFGAESAFGDEPLGFTYSEDGYELTNCLDSDVMILKSPFYTFARFCSPCVPGAGNLNDLDPEGVKTYCFGHDWFDDQKAPYPVYSVGTGELVNA